MAVTTQKLTQTSRVSAKVEGRPAHVNVSFLQIMGKFVTCRLAVRNFRPIMARFKMTAAIMRTFILTLSAVKISHRTSTLHPTNSNVTHITNSHPQ